jgi:tRNA (adenine37-N6)-methyltransferase
MKIQPIGTVKSPFIDKFGTPRQSQIAKNSISELVFDKKSIHTSMLSGFSVGDSIWVLFQFHLNNQKKVISKVHAPRLKGKKIGVLASRSPHRPNPIGLSLGKITDIRSHSLLVSGLDIVNGTPIVDIKPYLAEFDKPKAQKKKSSSKNAHWIADHPFTKLKVKFQTTASLPVKNKTHFKKCVREILQEDPRPLAYFSRPHHQYWLKYDQYDIGFTITESTLFINTIKPIGGNS